MEDKPETAVAQRDRVFAFGNLDAQIRETHTGLVALIGDLAYKAKKPVRTDFLDFTTAQQREAACLREVELNSRLAPTVISVWRTLSGRGIALTNPWWSCAATGMPTGCRPWSREGLR